MCLAKWRMQFAVPFTLVSITASNSSLGISHNFAFLLIIPALFTISRHPSESKLIFFVSSGTFQHKLKGFNQKKGIKTLKCNTPLHYIVRSTDVATTSTLKGGNKGGEAEEWNRNIQHSENICSVVEGCLTTHNITCVCSPHTVSSSTHKNEMPSIWAEEPAVWGKKTSDVYL